MEISVAVSINGQLIRKQLVPDPIHWTETKMGFLDRLKFLFSPGRFTVSVECSRDVADLITNAIPDGYKHSLVVSSGTYPAALVK